MILNQLRIEVESIDGQVINCSMLIGDHGNAGTVQFRNTKKGWAAIRRLESRGIPVKVPAYAITRSKQLK